jgi:hypothetical protein
MAARMTFIAKTNDLPILILFLELHFTLGADKKVVNGAKIILWADI